MPITDQMAAAINISGDGLPPEMGGYNEMPPNWRKITQSEFLWLFGQGQKKMHFRQVKHPSVPFGKLEVDPAREMYCDVYFWDFPDHSGIGWITHYNGMATRSREDAFLC